MSVETRCPITELFANQCAHCRSATAGRNPNRDTPATRTAPERPDAGSAIGPVIQSRYGGHCYACDEHIEVGDWITPTGHGDWVHAECGETY